jgi:hypothetical protein
MSLLAAAYATSGTIPLVAIIAATGIVALGVAGWVIRDVARTALQKSSEENVPHVIAALSGLLEQLRLFLPWQSGSPKSTTSEPRDSQPVRHPEGTGKLSKGGSQ